MAGELLMSISQDEVERARFRSRRKYQTDHQSDIATAKDNGKAEGRVERSIEIARTMIADGEPVEKVVRYTGLTIEELRHLNTAT